ncbi:MAG: hypothetical protein D6730_23390 [Bacteroidetes bacterium]|nr:MAG: hypothetical protein D6730_23390 [Bacteroidota bacterium]
MLYVLLQLFVFNHLTAFHLATPVVFILFLLMLPIDTPRPVLYLTAFTMGLIIDIFSENSVAGLHTFSSLLAVAFRSRLLILLGASGARGMDEFSFQNQGLLWYMAYLLPLIFIHHLAYFLLESLSFSQVFYTLFKAMVNTLYSFLFCYLICLIFYRK